MTDPDSTTVQHYYTLMRDLHVWMRQLMAVNDTRGLMEYSAELKWLSAKAGLPA